jgi:basic membrane protein A and related proteins
VKTSMRSLAVVTVTALVAGACGSAPEESDGGAAATGAAGKDFTACMVSDSGGIDDRSFNEAAFRGLQDAEKRLGTKQKFVESKTDSDYAPNISQLVADDCGLIVTVGFLMGDATSAAAAANPGEKFAIVDFLPEKPADNVKPLVFDTAQAAFLAGYVAAGVSQTGKVATFGGIKLPTVTIFMDGFADGVAYYNEKKGKDVRVLGWDKAAQNGSFTGDFEDQNKGKQLTQNFIQQGADIIHPVAGPVGLGAAAAAQATNGKVNLIWVDSDGYESAAQYKGLFVTSVLKRVDTAVEAATTDAVENRFTNEPFVGTLANEGVALAPFHDFDAKVPQELKDEVKQLQDDIVAGTVKVESPASPK